MKKAVLAIAFCAASLSGHGQYLQQTGTQYGSFPYASPYDSGLNPSLCDTLMYIFRNMTDNLYVPATADSTTPRNDSVGRPTVYSVNRIDSMNDNISSGNPFAFFVQYESGSDSAAMFKVFSDLIIGIKACLLGNLVQQADGFFVRNIDYPHKIRYEYVLTQLKPGINPSLYHAIVRVEFFPDATGMRSDSYIVYRVNIIVHP